MEMEINTLGYLQRKLSNPTEECDVLAFENLTNESWKVRRVCADYLSARKETVFQLLKDRLFEPFLSNNSMTEINQDLLYWSFKILGSINSEESKKYITDFYTHSNEEIRFHAFQCLSEKCNDQNLCSHISENSEYCQIFPVLLKGLSDDSHLVRNTALRGIKNLLLMNVNIGEELFKELNNISDSSLKTRLIKYVASFSGIKVIELINSHISDEIAEFEHYKILALGEINSNESTCALIQYFSNPARLIQEMAAAAIEKKGKDSLIALKDAVKSNNINIKYWAIILLGKIFRSRSIKYISRFLNDDDINIRYHAILALGRTYSSVAAPVLIKCLSEKSGILQQHAADMIVQIGEKAIPSIKKALIPNQNSQLNTWLIKCLCRLHKIGLKTIISRFTSMTFSNRICIFENIEPSDNKQLILFLIKCLKEEEWIIRTHSATLLEQCGSATVPYLKKSQESDYLDQRYWSNRIIDNIEKRIFEKLFKLLDSQKYASALKIVQEISKNFKSFNSTTLFKTIISKMETNSKSSIEILTKLLSYSGKDIIYKIVKIIEKDDFSSKRETFRHLCLALGMSNSPDIALALLKKKFKLAQEINSLDAIHIFKAISLINSKSAAKYCSDKFFEETDENFSDQLCTIISSTVAFKSVALEILLRYDGASYSERKKIDSFVKMAKKNNPKEIIRHIKKRPIKENRLFFSLISPLDKDLKTTILLPYLELNDKETNISALFELSSVDDSRLIIKILEMIDDNKLTSSEEQKNLIKIFDNYPGKLQIIQTLSYMDFEVYDIIKNWLAGYSELLPAETKNMIKSIQNTKPENTHNKVIAKKEFDSFQSEMSQHNFEQFGISLNIEAEKEILRTHSLETLIQIPYFRLVKVIGNIIKIPYGIVESSARITNTEAILITCKKYLDNNETIDGDTEVWFRRNCIKYSK